MGACGWKGECWWWTEAWLSREVREVFRAQAVVQQCTLHRRGRREDTYLT